jgi:hypothetical protein
LPLIDICHHLLRCKQHSEELQTLIEIAMAPDKISENDGPPGDAAPEILEGRVWVDGCWDFFHHGSLHPSKSF